MRRPPLQELEPERRCTSPVITTPQPLPTFTFIRSGECTHALSREIWTSSVDAPPGRQLHAAPRLRDRPVRRVAVTDDRSAVLLIRVWFDDDAFRARLTAMGLQIDGAQVEETAVAVAASPRDVLTAVEEWLADLVRDGE
jgi:hypothetical protein